MVIDVDGTAEILDVLIASDDRFREELITLIRNRRKLLGSWRESYKVAKALSDATGEPTAANPYELMDLVSTEAPGCMHDHYITHESRACLRIVSLEETGIDHRYCLCKQGKRVFLGRCTITCWECAERMRKRYRKWRDKNGGELKAICPAKTE